MDFIYFCLVVILAFLVLDYVINLIVTFLLSINRLLRVIFVVFISSFLISVYLDPEWTAGWIRRIIEVSKTLIGWAIAALEAFLELLH